MIAVLAAEILTAFLGVVLLTVSTRTSETSCLLNRHLKQVGLRSMSFLVGLVGNCPILGHLRISLGLPLMRGIFGWLQS